MGGARDSDIPSTAGSMPLAISVLRGSNRMSSDLTAEVKVHTALYGDMMTEGEKGGGHGMSDMSRM